MFELLPTIKEWQNNNLDFVIATVIKTWGSAPRKTGAMMIVNELGEFSGSVSGGCVETAVIQESIEIINTERPKLLNYGVSNDTAMDLGLACGGEIEIFCQLYSLSYKKLTEVASTQKAFSYSIHLDFDNPDLGKVTLDKVFEKSICCQLKEGQLISFHNSISQPPQLIIIGGVQIAQTLSIIAQQIGYTVLIIDPRRSFLTTARFPNAELINKWPDEALKEIEINQNSALIALSHDPKIDDPALSSALNASFFYVGALGSKKTQEERKSRLKYLLLDPETINNLKGPAGIDINAETPEEIAVSILSEIIKEANN